MHVGIIPLIIGLIYKSKWHKLFLLLKIYYYKTITSCLK